MKPDRCGTLEIDFGSLAPGASNGDDERDFDLVRSEANSVDCDARFATAKRDDVREAVPEPPSPETVDAGQSSANLEDAARRFAVDFDLPREVAPYVNPLETLRRDARCLLRLWSIEAARSARDSLERLLRSQDLPIPTEKTGALGACNVDDREERECLRELRSSGAWATLGSVELGRASEARFAASKDALASFERQLAACDPQPRADLESFTDWARRESEHVLHAAKGSLVSSWTAYARAAEREHACFREACQAAETCLGSFWANSSRALADLDQEVRRDLDVYRRKTRSAVEAIANRRGGCSDARLESLANRVVEALEQARSSRNCELENPRVATGGSGRDFCDGRNSCDWAESWSRLGFAAEELRRSTPSDRPSCVARALRELRRRNPGDAAVTALIDEAKPLVRACAAARVDLESLKSAMVQETVGRCWALLVDCQARLKQLETATAASFAHRIETSSRAKESVLAVDRDRLAADRANLASYENRLALHDQRAYYVLGHAKELLQQAVASAWAYDRLRMFRDWLLVRMKVERPNDPAPDPKDANS